MNPHARSNSFATFLSKASRAHRQPQSEYFRLPSLEYHEISLCAEALIADQRVPNLRVPILVPDVRQPEDWLAASTFAR